VGVYADNRHWSDLSSGAAVEHVKKRRGIRSHCQSNFDGTESERQLRPWVMTRATAAQVPWTGSGTCT
jgi:hypothetical protein